MIAIAFNSLSGIPGHIAAYLPLLLGLSTPFPGFYNMRVMSIPTKLSLSTPFPGFSTRAPSKGSTTGSAFNSLSGILTSKW